MRSIRYICLAFLLCLRAIPAQAEIAHETATRLLAVSGMAAVLQRLPAQMRDGFRKGFDVNSESTSPGQRAQIEAALEGAYSTDRMQASVLDRVRRGLDHDQAEALLRWYHGALGTEITRLETAGLGDERTGEQIIAENSARIADMSIYVQNVVPLIGIGVGVDYSVFVASRYRAELRSGRTPGDAAAVTTATAGTAIFFREPAVNFR